MEANRIEVLSPVVEQGESHNQGLHSDVVEDSIGNFDELLLFDHSEFDMYNLPILPSLRLSPPRVTTVGIDDVAAMVAINSMSPEESSSRGSMHEPKESSLRHARSLSMDSSFIADVDTNEMKKAGESNVDHCHRRSSSVEVGHLSSLGKRAMPPEKLAELASTDPKKAKRILANRKSAAISKERRTAYANELRERVKRLKAQAEYVTQELAAQEMKSAAMAARNNDLRMQLQAKQQELHETLAYNEAVKKEIQYYMMKNNELDAAMADDPSYGELLAKFTSQLSLQQFPNPPVPQHQIQTPLQPQPYLPELSYETNQQMLSGFDQQYSYTYLPPFPPSLPDPTSLPPLPPSLPDPNSLPFGQPNLNESCGPSFSNFNQMY